MRAGTLIVRPESLVVPRVQASVTERKPFACRSWWKTVSAVPVKGVPARGAFASVNTW